jgi:hypothetical protein
VVIEIEDRGYSSLYETRLVAGFPLRKALEAKEPDLVLARDNQTVIQRRSQLLAQRQANEKKRSQRL